MPASASDLVARLRSAGCVFAEDEAALLIAHEPDEAAREALVVRRIAGEPLEHLLGAAEFGGLRLAVGPGAFIPRQRSLLLVAEARRRLRRGARVADLCCGIGALGAALLADDPTIELYAGDIDPRPLRYARENLAFRAAVADGDLYAALPARLRGHVDAVIASPPYVPTAELGYMPPEARDHEPTTTHDGGDDGLELARRIVADASGWLAAEGSLLIETAEHQTSALAASMSAAGLTTTVVHDEETGGAVTIGVTS